MTHARIRPAPYLTSAFAEEAKRVRRLYFRNLTRGAAILSAMFIELTLGFLSYYLLLIPGILAVYFLFPAVVTSIYGQSRFFSRRAGLAILDRKFGTWATISVAAILSSIVFTTRGLISQPPTQLSTLAIILLPLSGVTLFGIVQEIATFNRVEVRLPQWLLLGRKRRTGFSWAQMNYDLMEKDGGLTVAIRNLSASPLVLTMVWIEWFAHIGVPVAFHREMRGHDEYSKTCRHKVINLDSPLIVGPKNASTWVLKWDYVRQFHEELISEKVWDEKFILALRISVYDEYVDEIYCSTEFATQNVLATEYSIKHKEQLRLDMERNVKMLEPLIPYIASYLREQLSTNKKARKNPKTDDKDKSLIR